MEMHQVRYFLAVAETLNFTRAAEQCHVAQPSLSRAVRKLEEELGGDLFRRERSQTHLTDLGRAMLPMLQQCHDSAQAAKAQAESYGNAGIAPLRIGVSRTVVLELLAPMFTELARAYPGLELSFQRGNAAEVLEELRAGKIEVAITASTGVDWDRFDGWALFEEGFALIVPRSHALARQKNITLADTASEPFVARPYCEMAEDLAAALAAHNVAPIQQHNLSNDTDTVALIESGLGVGILPASAAMSSAVRSRAVTDLDISRTVTVHAVAGRQRTFAASSFISLLRAADWPRPISNAEAARSN
jgi:DNA-binding transcriptional LysR family regulator